MASKRDGVRAALPLLVPLVALGASFGVLARGLHWDAVAPVVMSIVLRRDGGRTRSRLELDRQMVAREPPAEQDPLACQPPWLRQLAAFS